ncbi:MAG: efflux RND transporter permease subunit [Thermodesulfobacteriota bacterium]
MKLVDTSIKKPVSVAVGVIFIVLFGFIALFNIPVQLTPDVDKPIISVNTFWEGASPQEIETEIIREQEDELKTLDNLVEMTSESQDSSGNIVLEFAIGTDIDAAVVDVSNKLNQVQEYPDNVDQPVILTTDVGASAMAWFILKPKEGNIVDIYQYHDFANDFIKPRFERVSGVGSSNVFGGYEREMQVVVDPNALAARGITINEMADAIRSDNDNYSAGDFDEGKRRYIVRTVGEYTSPQDIENVIITRKNGAPVYVRDVANVSLGYKDADYAVRQNGEPAIAINAVKESGANSIDVMAGLIEAMDELNQGELQKLDLRMFNVYEETSYIVRAIDLVQQNLIIGGLLAVLVLLFFLRSASSTLIVATAIPISIIGTFVVMSALGRTINVISLAGMAFAVGMVIDNSIVVLENIYRHMQMGKSRVQAAYDGTVEVWGAVLASTLTTAAVFVPVIFVQDQAGQLFRDIAIAISVSVILSLIVSITVIPTISAKILSVVKPKPGRNFTNLWGITNRAESVSIAISNLVSHILSTTRTRILVVLTFTIGAILLSWIMMPKTEYLPEGNRNLVFGILIPPPGYNIGEFTDIGIGIEEDLRRYWEAEVGSEQAQELDGPLMEHFFYVATGRQAFMGARARKSDEVKGLMPPMHTALRQIPGMIAIVNQSSIFQRGIGEGRSINIQITGPDLEQLVGIAQKVFFLAMEKIPEGQVRPIPSLDLGNPEVQLVLNRERASDVGITNQELGFMLNALVDGATISEYQLDGDEIDLTLRGMDEYASRTHEIEDLMINTEGGKMLTLGSIADVNVTTGPEQINHYERQRTIAISVIPPEQMPLETAIEVINGEILAPLIQSGELSGAYDAILTGSADDLTKTRQALQWNFILAAIIAFLLMASLFESFLYPLVIMFSVPLAAFGGFLGLFVLNLFIYMPLNILTMLGFVILIGIVVNNAILIVHQSLNNIRDHAMKHKEAIVESVRSRIRPIFMSTTTSVFGMLPLIILPGSGSEFYRGLGSVVVGGLLVSTMFTLILVPSVFSLVLDAKINFSQWFSKIRGGTKGLAPSK